MEEITSTHIGSQTDQRSPRSNASTLGSTGVPALKLGMAYQQVPEMNASPASTENAWTPDRIPASPPESSASTSDIDKRHILLLGSTFGFLASTPE